MTSATARPRVTIAIREDRGREMLAERDLERLRAFADVHVEYVTGDASVEEAPAEDAQARARLTELAAASDALIVSPGAIRVDAAMLDAAPSLRFVGELEGDRFFSRIDVDAAAERGVAVVDTSHASSWGVAEYTLALAIFGLRDTGRFIRKMYDGAMVGNARTEEPERIANIELTGRRIGILGFGNIGWRLTELLEPFHTDIVAYDPYAPRELSHLGRVDFADLDTVLSTSDVVVCLVPLTPSTHGLIGERELRLMRKGATFINVSRGPVVNTEEMLRVARDGEIVFCLDVFDPEPIPADSEFRHLPNVLLTPHLAGRTDETRPRYFELMVDELRRHFEGREPRSQVTARVVEGRKGRA